MKQRCRGVIVKIRYITFIDKKIVTITYCRQSRPRVWYRALTSLKEKTKKDGKNMNFLIMTLMAEYGPEALELVALYIRIQIKMAALFPAADVVRSLTDVIH